MRIIQTAGVHPLDKKIPCPFLPSVSMDEDNYCQQVRGQLVSILQEARRVSEKDFKGMDSIMAEADSCCRKESAAAAMRDGEMTGKRPRLCAEEIYDRMMRSASAGARMTKIASGITLAYQEWNTPEGWRAVSMGWEKDPAYGPYHVEILKKTASEVIVDYVPGTHARFMKVKAALAKYRQYNARMEKSGATKAGPEEIEENLIQESIKEQESREAPKADPDKVVIVMDDGNYLGLGSKPTRDLNRAIVYSLREDNVAAQLEEVKRRYNKNWMAIPYDPTLACEDNQPEV